MPAFSSSLRSHQVQQEGPSISVRTVQPAKVHSFHSTKRLALSTALFMFGMMSNGQNSYFTSNFFFCLKALLLQIFTAQETNICISKFFK